MKKIITTIMFFCLFTLFNVGLADKIKLPFGHISNPSAENLPTFSGTCEDLYPIKSFDDLMFQLYSHLDDDCLYLMPMAELSEKLGIGVVPYSFNRGKVMEGKDTPYRNFRDGIWLEKMDIGKEITPSQLTLQQQRGFYQWQQSPSSTARGAKPYQDFRKILYNVVVTPTYERHVEQVFQYRATQATLSQK